MNNINNSKCENCGGNLEFSPTHKSLHCLNCGTNKEIIVTNKFYKHPLDFKVNKSNIDNWKNNNSVYECQNCGGKVILSNLEISTTCPYCNTAIVAKTNNLPELLPDQIIPFYFDKVHAKEHFKQGIKKKHFIPNRFKKSIPDSEITAFYGSAFSFDANVVIRYSGELYRNIENRDGSSTTETVSVSGTLNKSFRDYMIEATSQLSQIQFEKIAPYNLRGAVDYDDDFVRGYGTEYYNNSIKQSYSVVKNRIESEATHDILFKHDCDGVRYLNKNAKYNDEKYSYVLFPVYKFIYKYKKKNYCTFVNGQTGKVGGGVPRSGAKISCLVGGILFAILGIILLCVL